VYPAKSSSVRVCYNSACVNKLSKMAKNKYLEV
jgi:hypothetical protein